MSILRGSITVNILPLTAQHVLKASGAIGLGGTLVVCGFILELSSSDFLGRDGTYTTDNLKSETGLFLIKSAIDLAVFCFNHPLFPALGFASAGAVCAICWSANHKAVVIGLVASSIALVVPLVFFVVPASQISALLRTQCSTQPHVSESTVLGKVTTRLWNLTLRSHAPHLGREAAREELAAYYLSLLISVLLGWNAFAASLKDPNLRGPAWAILFFALLGSLSIPYMFARTLKSTVYPRAAVNIEHTVEHGLLLSQDDHIIWLFIPDTGQLVKHTNVETVAENGSADVLEEWINASCNNVTQP